MARRSGLGRGLFALIPDSSSATTVAAEAEGVEPPGVTEVEVDRIVANPEQPRTRWDGEELAELAESIRTHGVIQPLLVSEQDGPDGEPVYQLIAGERRLRAAREAGLDRVPVVVRQTTPRELLELALVENVQRADLDPLEEAHAYQRLCTEFKLTQAEVAERVGRSRASVTNAMRLLELPQRLREALAAREITEGHARALLGLPGDEERIAGLVRVLGEGLNVRQTEAMVRDWGRADAPPEPGASPSPSPSSSPGSPPSAPGLAEEPDHQSDALESALQRALGTRVVLRRNREGQGTLTVHFYSDEELEGVVERLVGRVSL